MLLENGSYRKPRLVATDIDGTIVPFNGTVSGRTRAALHHCVESGVEVVLVTGRPPRWLPPVLEATGLEVGTAICANGAIVIDVADLSTISISPIAADTLHEVVARIEATVGDAVFAAESSTVLRMGPGYADARRGPRQEGLVPSTRAATQTSSVAEMLDAEGLIKVVVASPGSTPDALLDHVRRQVGDLVSVTRSAAGRALVEFGPLGITKASALATHAASLGLDARDVVAFGDMPNDTDMLEWAGMSYAMAGAHPEALAAAQFTAPAAEHDGVAHVLERMFQSQAATVSA